MKEFGLEEHEDAVADVGDDPGVSLYLPKLGLHICLIPLASLYTQLVEWRKDRHKHHLPLGLEICLQTHMIV